MKSVNKHVGAKQYKSDRMFSNTNIIYDTKHQAKLRDN